MPKSKQTAGTSSKKPTKRINPKIAKPYKTEYAEMAQRMAAAGANEMDIAYMLGTSTTNLRKWKKDHPDFAKCLNRGAQFTLAYLIGKGIQKAGGYDYEEVRTKVNNKGEQEVVKTVKHVPPDGHLLMFLAGCLDRRLGGDTWQSKQFVESKSEKNVNIKVIDGGKIAEQIDKLGGKWARAIECEFVEKEPKQLVGETESNEVQRNES